jgi:signal transduction histidine kinase
MTRHPLSIRARFLLVSLAIVPVALVLAALFFTSLFTVNLQRRIESELTGHSNNLAAAIRFQPDGRLLRPTSVFDHRFSKAYGGLYWQIDDKAMQTQLRSESLWDVALGLPDSLAGDSAVHHYELAGPGKTRLLVQERRIIVNSPTGRCSLRIAVAADRQPLDDASRAFALDILPYVAGLAVLLILASLAQVTLGLRPLATLKEGLDRIRQHRSGRLNTVLPKEFAPVEAALNQLLDSQNRAIGKARARAGDLAHGLKTPLTVLANDALRLREKGEAEIADEVDHLVSVMRAHVEREITRSRIAASAQMRQSDGDLAKVIGEIVRTLKRMAGGEILEWHIDMPQTLCLPVDPHDLRELAGNLVENAVKWAQSTVHIHWQPIGAGGALIIEDDGPGIAPDKIRSMTERGVRHDEQAPGFGLGLSIVQEICDVYSLVLAIENRQPRGLRVSVVSGSA